MGRAPRPNNAAASGELPSSLPLKIYADPEKSFGPSEHHYHTRDYRGYAPAPLVRPSKSSTAPRYSSSTEVFCLLA